jgi:hypothetical protein
MPHRMRETAGDAFQIGKDPIPPLVMKAIKGGTEKLAVIHRGTWNLSGPKGEDTFLEGFHNRCRAVFECRPHGESIDFDQVWVRVAFDSAMQNRKPRRFLKLF